MRKALLAIMALSVIAGLSFEMASYSEETPKTTVVTKEISGEVGGISANFIAVIYSYSGGVAREMAFNIAKDARASGRKLNEIGLGDIVKVIYEETIATSPGQKPMITKREAKHIEFQRQASRKPDEADSTTLVSQEQ